jgi:hypothetical protein
VIKSKTYQRRVLAFFLVHPSVALHSLHYPTINKHIHYRFYLLEVLPYPCITQIIYSYLLNDQKAAERKETFGREDYALEGRIKKNLQRQGSYIGEEKSALRRTDFLKKPNLSRPCMRVTRLKD